MIPVKQQQLGRLPSPYDARTLWLSDYLIRGIEEPPICCGWHSPVPDWGVMGNNRYGNCVIVTAAHMILAWRANELSDTARISDEAVIALSREMGALSGFNILERLKYWRKSGMWSDKLWSFAAVIPADPYQVKLAINSFGGCDIGVNLPSAWKGKEVWDVGQGPSYRPGTWGGHSVPLCGYDSDYCFAVSWGSVVRISWAALAYYCDEAYALIDRNWLAADAVAPSGFDLDALHSQLNHVSQLSP